MSEPRDVVIARLEALGSIVKGCKGCQVFYGYPIECPNG
jgi:hypothetical protein